jgi:hypothetical protein
MKTMTVRQFLEMTGMSQATLRRRLIALDVSPIGVSNEGRTSWLWAVEDLKKAYSGKYSAPRGRPRKVW